MSRQTTKQHGITLVEVMLTLAISSLLIASVLAGRNSVRSQAQFSDGVERIKETVLGIKSDANTGNNATGNGSNDSSLTLGRVITFTRNSNTVTTSTLLCTAITDAGCDQSKPISLRDSKEDSLPWGIVYSNSNLSSNSTLSLLFTRNGQNAEFVGYWYPGKPSADSGRLADYTNPANQAPIVLELKSLDGRKATLSVNPATGTVTRQVL